MCAPRASDVQDGSAAAGGGRISNPRELERHTEQVNLLWGRARNMDDWLPAYEGWKSDPKNQVMLGLR
jgi:hypothetical protein